MRFTPQVSSAPEHERQSFFVIHPKGLVARFEAERLELPSASDFAALGVQLEDARRFGTLDDTDALVVPFASEVPAPFEIVGLRALAGLLDSGLFGVVGHAMHTADWLSTSRFCGRCGAATERALPPVPPPISIARQLIDAWVAELRGASANVGNNLETLAT